MTTSRLTLRSFSPDDFDEYFTHIMDPQLQIMLGLDLPNRDAAKQTFDWLMQNSIFLALELNETGRIIGHISIQPAYQPAAVLRPGLSGCSLSFAVSKSHRRKGMMEEALRAVISDLFQNGTDYIDCEYTADNLPSRLLQEKLGFREAVREQFGDLELTVCILDRTIP